MKKLRIQPSFASLSEAELEQLADLIQRETYAAVRERIRKPRSEGGFDLHISKGPLERLLDKKNTLDLINARLSAQNGERKKLTLAELNSFISGDTHAPDEVHDVIMSATCDLVTSCDNTPHQLLALQRLADFPARSALRDQMAELRADRAALDHRKFEHKLDMDTFRKHSATERLHLAKRALTLREQLAHSRSNPGSFEDNEYDSEPSAQDVQDNGRGEFHPRPTSRSRDEITPTPAGSAHRNLQPNPVHPSHPDQDPASSPSSAPIALTPPTQRSGLYSSAPSKGRICLDTKGRPFLRFPGPCPLPDELVAINRAYAEKLLAGLVDPITGDELPSPEDPPAPEPTSPSDPNPCNADEHIPKEFLL